jgi:uncharacterized membrane protein YfcA
MNAPDLALISGAAFVAGSVNAIAGGGSLISFPALLAVGYPSVTANVTNSVALLPGYLGGSIAYRDELSGQGRRIRSLGAVSALGAVAGSALLLVSSESLFRRLVPFLILFSCALLAAQPVLARWAGKPSHRAAHPPAVLLPMQFAIAVYGGYFGAGLGILMLGVLGVYLGDDLHEINALKGVLSLVVAAVSAVFFAIFGPVVWTAAAAMAVMSLAGGQAGVFVAKRFSGEVLRNVVVVFGVAVSIWLLLH